MLVTYNGPHPEVVVDELDQEQVIKAGEPVEIPDPLAARLLEQSTWEQAPKPAPISTPTPASVGTLPDTTKVEN